MMGHPQNSLEHAIQLHLSGRIQEAINLYRKLLRKQPANAQLLFLLGTANSQIGQVELAIEQLKQSLLFDDANPITYLQLGTLYLDRQHRDEALIYYDKALALKPDSVEAYNNRGSALMGLKRTDEALASYDKALALKPDHVTAHNNRGSALQELERLSEALISYDKALALKPDYAEAYYNRGNVLKDLKRLDEALVSYDKALALEPDYAEAYYNQGIVLIELERMDEALASYNRALSLQPDLKYLAGNILHMKMFLCDWAGFTENVDMLLADVSLGKPVTEPFVLLSLVDSPSLHRQAARIYVEKEYPKQVTLGPFVHPIKNNKIRIGYYSANFHNHAVAYLTAELFEAHDPSRFELFGFTFGPSTNDEMQQRISAAFDRFIDVRGMSNHEVAQLSRELGIDIAVDLMGHTEDSRTGIFAVGAAPIQINYLGYPGTIGADYIDYIVADKTVIPEEQQSDFVEKVVYLPNSYLVNDSKRSISDRLFTKQELGLPEDGFVFCCFNNNYKILPAVFDSWMRILKATEGSVLWLREANPATAANLRKEAEQRGVAGNRLIFAKRMQSQDEHLARHRYADLFIDSLPYNAHTTASDALWAGLPVLTCMGRSFASRVAASLLNTLGLPELITRTQQEYETKAIELATQPNQLCEIKTKLERNRLTTPLFNGKLFAKHLEAAFEAMYSRHREGLPPEVIEVQS